MTKEILLSGVNEATQITPTPTPAPDYVAEIAALKNEVASLKAETVRLRGLAIQMSGLYASANKQANIAQNFIYKVQFSDSPFSREAEETLARMEMENE